MVIKNIYLPNIDNYNNIKITDVLVSKGDIIKKDTNIITIESGKTSINIPSPYNGVVNKVMVCEGDNVEKKTVLLEIETTKNKTSDKISEKDKNCTKIIKLSKNKILSNNILKKSWKNIPHVTQFSKINIDSLVKTYIKNKKQLELNNKKITLLPFIIKGITETLILCPYFNSSIKNEKEIIIKKYYNIGIITQTPRDLITLVVKNANKKSILEINHDLILKKEKLKKNKLTIKDTGDSSFSISNLGKKTTSFFTPIIKYPESAIIGLSQYDTKTIILKKKQQTQIILPISLSYDHRIINALDAIYFIKTLENKLKTIKSIY